MVFGSVTEIFNSNNVKFDMDDTINPLEEIIFITNFRNSKVAAQNRTITRNGAVDTPSFVLREFTIDAHITKDLYDRLEAITGPTTRGANTTLSFRMRAEAVQAGNDITLNFDGFVWSLDAQAGQDEKFDATFIIRADENTIVVS